MLAAEERRYFAPEDVERLTEALNSAWAAFDEMRRSETHRAELAQHIMMRANEGERDLLHLRDYALAKARLRAAWLDLDMAADRP